MEIIKLGVAPKKVIVFECNHCKTMFKCDSNECEFEEFKYCDKYDVDIFGKPIHKTTKLANYNCPVCRRICYTKDIF